MEVISEDSNNSSLSIPEPVRKITPEKKAEYNKRFYERHIKGQGLPESIKQSQKKYREQNKEKYRELSRLAQQRHRDKLRKLATQPDSLFFD